MQHRRLVGHCSQYIVSLLLAGCWDSIPARVVGDATVGKLRLHRFRASNSTSENAPTPVTLLSYSRRQPSALTPSFFRNQPIVNPPAAYGNNGATAPNGAKDADNCHPKCWWSCGNADCDEVCDPVCAPPQCETACGPLNLATCRQQCDPPKCAIVCPSQHCEHGDCPACHTVCAPAKCETICAEQCDSKCAEPQCSWKCDPGKCDKPSCTLTCGGAKMCNYDKSVNSKPGFKAGMHTVSAGLAAYDPATLGVAVMPEITPAAPAPAPAQPIPTLIR